MAGPQNPSFFRKAGLAAWAMFTLILVFCVLLLASELMKSGRSPLDLSQVSEKENAVIAQGPSSSSQLTNIPIYVVSADGAALVQESRNIPFGENTVDNCRAALDELKKPSQNIGCTPVLPPIAEYNALFLMQGGELVIDFKLTWQNAVPKSASGEAMMVYGVVNTLTQRELKGANSEQVRTVRFLFEGRAPENLFPVHLDLANPITPDPQWIRKVETAQ
ncbi:MAG: GerMN domain-containing protein [Candidatus Hydrogenedentes bacterium]|nr:GerMN domain-containing protein [Candidatus Hydrogenedentota bacterium]